MEIPDIQYKIYEIREQKVMLDFDLAILYEVETRVLNQSVKRNMDNFPDEFMFQLSLKEWEEVLSSKSILYLDDVSSNSSQIVMSSRKHRGKSYTPYAFTEHGVGMLACVLKSPKARKMNIAIVKTFIALRKSVSQFSNMREQLSELRE